MIRGPLKLLDFEVGLDLPMELGKLCSNETFISIIKLNL